ncbi:MAG: pectinesterase family protein [Phycisphaerales bacterium]
MKHIGLFVVLLSLVPAFSFADSAGRQTSNVSFFPESNSVDVNPDTHLVLTFAGKPKLGKSGLIRIYDAADDRLVDVLDMSIPAGPIIKNNARVPYAAKPYNYVSAKHCTNANTKPGTPSGTAVATPSNYQLTIIGGFSDGFHFYPVIIRGRTATIYPHNNLLEYGKTYYVQIDAEVFRIGEKRFHGISERNWTFSTKKSPPSKNFKQLVVASDGSGDFSTVQGAVDFVPDKNLNRMTIFIKNGTYEEIVYFRNKTNITFLGEDRNKTIVCYANNEVFNPHPVNVATNEMAGTFPSRRAVFMGDNSKGIRLINFTIKNLRKGQAEGLLLMGQQNLLSNMNIIGSGDALQVNGSAYIMNTKITGDMDIILGRGPAFFKDCQLVSTGGCYMWVRNTSANHGFVFSNCKFKTLYGETEIARAPTNHGKDYPNCEAVLLNCQLQGISPQGWGEVGGDTAKVHYWEYNSTNLSDGQPADVSKRSPVSRQLGKDKDAGIIANYSNPAYVLGWKPVF